MKRIICIILAITCVFFTGCNSIIYNGNLDFETYDPPELITEKAIKKGVSEAAAEKENENKLKKYNIEGVNAFYILDGHEDDPDKILDFQVLDYTSNGTLIYAYMTPCYGEETLLSGTTGQAPENRKWHPNTDKNKKEAKRCVTVLMSYHPFSREYKVFFSGYGSLDDVIAREKKFEGEDAELGSVRASSKNSLLMVQKLVQQEKYFIFFQNVSYVYDKDGNQKERNDYGTLIAEEIARFAKRYQTDDTVIETSINDVAMDGNGYLYLSLMLERTKKSASDATTEELEDADLTEEDAESQTFSELLCIYQLTFDDQVRFTSTNLNWENQKQAWMSADGMSFGSEDELEDFLKENSMEDIKAGTAGDSRFDEPDTFSVYESGEPLNLQLVGQNLLYSGSGKESVKRFRQITGQMEQYLYVHGVISEISQGSKFPIYFIPWEPKYDNGHSIVWDVFYPDMIQTMKKGLVLLSQENSLNSGNAAIKEISRILQLPENYQIPGVAPGSWDKEKQKNNQIFPLDGEFSSDGDFLLNIKKAIFLYRVIDNALMVSKSTIYANGTKVSRYADITIPYWEKVVSRSLDLSEGVFWELRFHDLIKKYPYQSPTVQVKEMTEELERILYVEEVQEEAKGDGESESETEVVLIPHEDHAASYPKTYELTFPEGTSLHWLETRETEAMVAPTSELGLFYYWDNEQENEEESTSSIVFQSGETKYLEEHKVPGKIQDAGCLTYGDTEVLVYITTEGVSFFKRPGKNQKFQKLRTTPLTEFVQNTAFSIGTNGNITYFQKVEEELQTKKGSEEDKIIKKGMKSGTQSEIYTVSNFTPMNPNEIILSSLTGGILLHNMKNGLSIQLDKGAYFSSFPLTEEQAQNGKFLCIGYATEEYTYDRMDLAWAKCYTYNLKAQGDQVKEKAVKEYLMNRSITYLEQTHQVVYETDKNGNKTAKIVAPDEAQKKEIQDAENLFYGTKEMTQAELEKLMQGLGFGTPSKELRDYAESLASMRQNQKSALEELYRLVGMSRGEIQKDPEFLEMEGNLIFTNSPNALENALISLQLTDKAIERIQLTKEEKEIAQQNGESEGQLLQEKRKRYYQYKIQAENTAKANKEQEQFEVKIEENQIIKNENTADAEAAKARIEESEYREKILSDLARKYQEQPKKNEAGEIMEWNEYLESRLKLVSPDNGSLLTEEGVEQFRQITGIQEALVTDSQLQKELEDISMLWELERLILKYELSTSAYQSSPWKMAFKKFDEEMVFSDSAERRRFFYSSDFYEVIKNMAKEYEKALDGAERSWDRELQEIIIKSGKGVVLQDADRPRKEN